LRTKQPPLPPKEVHRTNNFIVGCGFAIFILKEGTRIKFKNSNLGPFPTLYGRIFFIGAVFCRTIFGIWKN
jgi:hypothetical protein